MLLELFYIEESLLVIHLINYEVHVSGKGKRDPDCFKSCNRSKVLSLLFLETSYLEGRCEKPLEGRRRFHQLEQVDHFDQLDHFGQMKLQFQEQLVKNGAELTFEAEVLFLPLAGAEDGSFIMTPFKASALNADLNFKIDLIVFGQETVSDESVDGQQTGGSVVFLYDSVGSILPALAIRLLFLTIEALEAEALELRKASSALTLLYLASIVSKSLIGLSSVPFLKNLLDLAKRALA
ncbi:hypothetical protein Tco_1112234 [Tanacetum coccineum]|uniref:Uncharacterized protein n=1 Tax=Tanacetum coccineum TaxID=301880 RepID=A0ABQ5IQ22_9ASTR